MSAPTRKDHPPDFHSKEINVYSILSIIFGFILPPFGLLFALVSLSQIKKDKTQDGRSIALVGLVISIILNVFILLFILAIILIKISV